MWSFSKSIFDDITCICQFICASSNMIYEHITHVSLPFVDARDFSLYPHETHKKRA